VQLGKQMIFSAHDVDLWQHERDMLMVGLFMFFVKDAARWCHIDLIPVQYKN
jgi:hypothetical protein